MFSNRLKFLFTSFFSVFVFVSVSVSAFTIVIDPGHGGSDKGANRGSFIESDIVFKIAEKLKLKLSEAAQISANAEVLQELESNSAESPSPNNKRIQIYLTRENEIGATLKERVTLAHRKSADLFLSLHANSSTSSQVSGMEYYFNAPKKTAALLKSKHFSTKEQTQLEHTPSELIETSEPPSQSTALVKMIQNDLIEFGKTKQSLELSQTIQTIWNQGDLSRKQPNTSKIRRAPFYVIENTQMPSVLVEVGFISNQREARKLITEEYQNELAHALSLAILEFKEKSDK